MYNTKIEKNKLREYSQPILRVVGPVTIIIAGSLCTFNGRLTDSVKERQRNRCAHCGEKCKNLQVHHRVPKSWGGAPSRDNAEGLCPKCHKLADEMALREGKFRDGSPLDSASERQVRNRGLFELMLSRIRPREDES